MMQLSGPIFDLIGTVFLAIVVLLFLTLFICRGKVHESPDEVKSNPSEASQLLERIKAQRERARLSIEEGELKRAQQELSIILEDISRNMVKLIPLGPKNSSDLKDEVAFTLDETTAKILLQDLRQGVRSLDEFIDSEINILEPDFNEDRFDCISRDCNLIADEIEEIATHRSLERIRDEVRILRLNLKSKVEMTKKRFSTT